MAKSMTFLLFLNLKKKILAETVGAFVLLNYN